VVKLPFINSAPPKAVQQKRVAQAPRTQDQMLVVALQDDVLILRNLGVVAALEVESVDDTLIDPKELEARLAIYRYDLLKQVRFDFQFLIGTRAQNLTPYYQVLSNQIARWESYETKLRTMLEGLDDLLAKWSDGVGASFEQHFGFKAEDLWGVPGDAREAALVLIAEGIAARWAGMDESQRSELAAELRAAALGSLECVQHYQALLHDRAAFVQLNTQQIQAPVRTVHIVMSYYPRLIASGSVGGPLSEAERAHARAELARRCEQFARVLKRMGIATWRVSGEALLELVRGFYHPSSAQMLRRAERE
jgi:hypothetical protein